MSNKNNELTNYDPQNAAVVARCKNTSWEKLERDNKKLLVENKELRKQLADQKHEYSLLKDVFVKTGDYILKRHAMKSCLKKLKHAQKYNSDVYKIKFHIECKLQDGYMIASDELSSDVSVDVDLEQPSLRKLLNMVVAMLESDIDKTEKMINKAYSNLEKKGDEYYDEN